MTTNPTPRSPGNPIDGRRARGERTKERVLRAFGELIAEDNLHPTALEVAEHAGVALRTVYHHFADVNALRTLALKREIERDEEFFRTVDAALPLDARITFVAQECRKVNETITPVRRAMLADEQQSLAIASGLRRSRLKKRSQLQAVFEPELGDAPELRDLLDAVDVATSWESWNHLRAGLGRSAAASERVVERSLNQLLSLESRAIGVG